MITRRYDLTGQRFGRLFVVERARNGTDGTARWLVQCDCGTQKTVRQRLLVAKKTRSCGCLHRERASEANSEPRKHGHARRGAVTAEYQAWQQMLVRCYNPRHTSWASYGGRGISVCGRWRDSFESFLEDVGPRPSSDHSLGRREVDGDYDPDNVRWATAVQQARNPRRPSTQPQPPATPTRFFWRGRWRSDVPGT